ncbi:hypothetical protein SORBI_3006G041432 [Sorghum bicolor]|uniref:Uncharacterized protein n=1 Tax=Sorghum bicolor TaxID=4558 RepID=A0A1Z5RD00_SORBI|nr:hypothetical protein SORBI_3006G041432 [Sorghum bicolor]
MYSTKTKTELSGRCCSSWDNRPRFEAPPAGLNDIGLWTRLTTLSVMDLQLAAGVDLPQTAVRVYVCVVLVRSQLRVVADWGWLLGGRGWLLMPG